MFLVEQQVWSIPKTPEGKADFEKIKKKIAREEEKAKKGLKNDFEPVVKLDVSVSDKPDGAQAVYAMNDTFIELRTPFDEKRGGITFAAACFVGPMMFGLLTIILDIFAISRGVSISGSGEFATFEEYFFTILSLLTVGSVLAVVLFFGWRYLRLESFVQRRLLVRFNRKTRKVYVHRPAYAGGMVELDWEKAQPQCVPNESEAFGVGVPLIFMWLPQHTPTGAMELLMVGRMARGNSEIVNLWEFIRRFMEEGPQSVPRPRLIGKFPWPWTGIKAAASLVWPLWKMASLRWMVPLLLLISPAILLFAAGHWLSLLTCWEPVWPRAIREACDEGWESVLRAKLIDMGAWGMSVGVIWWLLPATT